MITDIDKTYKYDVFLSHSHKDVETINFLAQKLDKEGLSVWLDTWILIPGETFRQKISKGLELASTCAVFIGQETPKGWFNEEVNKAVNIQTQNPSFRVIPVLLPGSDKNFVNDFLELRTWVDFKDDINAKRAFHELICGIKGIKPGRKHLDNYLSKNESQLAKKLAELNSVSHLIDLSVKIEIQKMILIDHLIQRNGN